MCGDVQAAYTPDCAPSIRHSNRTADSEAVNSNVGRAFRMSVPGATVSIVFGAPVSTVTVAVVGSDTFPAASVAVTVYVWVPSATCCTACDQRAAGAGRHVTELVGALGDRDLRGRLSAVPDIFTVWLFSGDAGAATAGVAAPWCRP